jgi:hypothetical protein
VVTFIRDRAAIPITQGTTNKPADTAPESRLFQVSEDSKALMATSNPKVEKPVSRTPVMVLRSKSYRKVSRAAPSFGFSCSFLFMRKFKIESLHEILLKKIPDAFAEAR